MESVFWAAFWRTLGPAFLGVLIGGAILLVAIHIREKIRKGRK